MIGLTLTYSYILACLCPRLDGGRESMQGQRQSHPVAHAEVSELNLSRRGPLLGGRVGGQHVRRLLRQVEVLEEALQRGEGGTHLCTQPNG